MQKYINRGMFLGSVLLMASITTSVMGSNISDFDLFDFGDNPSASQQFDTTTPAQTMQIQNILCKEDAEKYIFLNHFASTVLEPMWNALFGVKDDNDDDYVVPPTMMREQAEEFIEENAELILYGLDAAHDLSIPKAICYFSDFWGRLNDIANP